MARREPRDYAVGGWEGIAGSHLNPIAYIATASPTTKFLFVVISETSTLLVYCVEDKCGVDGG